MTYLNAAQVDQLLKAIHPSRVGKRDDNGMSHLESYDVRAHLTRIFGFARWSADLTDLTPLYESLTEKAAKSGGGTYEVVSVGYRATIKLSICAPDGTLLATYTEAAAGSATNFPINKRGDAHDFALKTAESQALKRCAMNLADQFGLSLYQSGSRDALVKRTLVMPEGEASAEDVDHDIVPVTPEVGEEPTPPSPAAVMTPPAVAPAAPAQTPPDELAQQELLQVQHLRDRAIAAHKEGRQGLPALAKINLEASKAKLMQSMTSRENGEHITLGLLVDELIRNLARGAA